MVARHRRSTSRDGRRRKEDDDPSPDQHSASLWPAAVIVTAGIVAFAPGFDAPFVFDDSGAIVGNPHLRQFWPPRAEPQSAVAGRPLISMSLAINAAIGGLNPAVYRAWNLGIHLVAAVLLLGILRRTLSRPAIPAPVRQASNPLALVAALVWLIHPLQTEVIGYVIQRTESMMGMFYFLTLYASIRYMASQSWRWAALAIGSCAAGMACKESMVTAPVVVLLYDAVFETGSVRHTLGRRRWFYFCLASSWLLLAALLAPGPRWRSAGFRSGISPWAYLLRQTEMIPVYLRLSIWPHPLVLDYGVAEPTTLRAVLPTAIVVAALLVASLLMWRRWTHAAFVVTWFWITLAPTSSFVPIQTEVGAERRMYLPLAAIVTLAVVGSFAALRGLLDNNRARRLAGVTAAGLVAALFVGLDLRRHAEYRSPIGIWQTVLDRRPHGRAHYNLGVKLAEAGRIDEAIAHYREAAPTHPRGHYGLGVELERRGEYDAAAREYQAFVERLPDDFQAPQGYTRLGIVLAHQQRWTEAIAALERAVRMRPHAADAWSVLGDSLFAAERYVEAEQAYGHYGRLMPEDPVGYQSRGLALVALGREVEAIQMFERAIQLDPGDGATRLYLGNTLVAVGRADAAVDQYREGLRLVPDSPHLPLALAMALAHTSRAPEALEVLEQAVRRHPLERDMRLAFESLRREVSRGQ